MKRASGGVPTTSTWRSEGQPPATSARRSAPSSSTTARAASARTMRAAMSRPVSWVVAGIATTPARNMPSSASYHAGTRGSITKARSPAPTPRPASALAKRRAPRATSANPSSRRSRPSRPTQTRAVRPGSLAARASTTSRV